MISDREIEGGFPERGEIQAKLSLKNKQVRHSTGFEKEGCENTRQKGRNTFDECMEGVDLTVEDQGESIK